MFSHEVDFAALSFCEAGPRPSVGQMAMRTLDG